MESQPKDRAAVSENHESGIKQLVRLFDHKYGIDQRKAARK